MCIQKKNVWRKEIETDLPRCEMCELLYLCMKNVHFTFNNKIYIQNDGLAMGSPLGLVLTNISEKEIDGKIPFLDNLLVWN